MSEVKKKTVIGTVESKRSLTWRYKILWLRNVVYKDRFVIKSM